MEQSLEQLCPAPGLCLFLPNTNTVKKLHQHVQEKVLLCQIKHLSVGIYEYSISSITSYKPAAINVPPIYWLTDCSAILPGIKPRCFCGEGLHHKYNVIIKHSFHTWGLQKLKIINGKRHWDSKWPQHQCFWGLCIPQVSTPGKLVAVYTLLKGILFGDDCWKLADLLISSILFIIIHDWKVMLLTQLCCYDGKTGW